MLDKLQKYISGEAWKLFATMLIILIAGPEILLSMELIAFVNIIGADIFVILTFTSFFTFCIKPILQKVITFEENTNFCIPPMNMVNENPACLLFLIPHRTLFYAFIFLILPVMFIKLIILLLPLI